MRQGSLTRSRREVLQAGVFAMMAGEVSARAALAAGSGQSGSVASSPLSPVKALVFDTFGTVVDWRSSVAQDVEAVARRKALNVDGGAFADRWRAGYQPSMQRVRSGALPWTKLDRLHRMILDTALVEFGVTGLSEEETDALNRAWHRLRPWHDAIGGLTRLKARFIVAPLSNGNVSLMTNMAKHAGLPWDCILGAELARHYKPDPEVYQSAADFLDLKVGEVMMVAAHSGDLRAAREVGLKTAFVPRPQEYGPNGKPELKPAGPVDVVASDFNDLARQMGA